MWKAQRRPCDGSPRAVGARLPAELAEDRRSGERPLFHVYKTAEWHAPPRARPVALVQHPQPHKPAFLGLGKTSPKAWAERRGRGQDTTAGRRFVEHQGEPDLREHL